MKEQHKKESPVLSLLGMGGGGTGVALGGALTPSKTYVDDVFSTALYIGNASSNTVPSGLDFTGGSWLSWIKLRDGSDSHYLSDSTQKTGVCFDSFASDRTYGKQTGETTGINAVGTSSYSIQGGNAQVNGNTKKYTSWNFKTKPGFFDIVTYSGNDTARAIPHNLGSVPGMIIVKKTSDSGGWYTYHRSMGNTKWLDLSSPNDASTVNLWNNQTPTATNFYVSTNVNINGSGEQFIAYIFAHDEASFGTDEDESIVKCGTYTGNGGSASSTNDINLGFEPQWILIKSFSNNNEDWVIADTMRGSFDPGTSYDNMKYLRPNLSNNEAGTKGAEPTSTGFKVRGAFGHTNGSGQTYIYMAIRRPNKPPEVGTDVFAIDTKSAGRPGYTSNFPVDLVFNRNNINSSDSISVETRLTSKQLVSNTTAAEGFDMSDTFSCNTGWDNGGGVDTTDYAWMFKRAPGFMDVVTWTGTQVHTTVVNHNLTVVPEMTITKRRDSARDWYVWHKDNSLANGTGNIRLNLSNEGYPGDSAYHGVPTATQITQGVNDTGNFVAYLFATLPGISKVGSYTGTGNAINVPCGFTNGARFVIIKRSDSSGDWYLWDSVRGIVAGNDPYILLNSTAAQVTNTDYVDPLTSGFTVTASAPAALNASGGTYLFLAIA